MARQAGSKSFLLPPNFLFPDPLDKNELLRFETVLLRRDYTTRSSLGQGKEEIFANKMLRASNTLIVFFKALIKIRDYYGHPEFWDRIGQRFLRNCRPRTAQHLEAYFRQARESFLSQLDHHSAETPTILSDVVDTWILCLNFIKRKGSQWSFKTRHWKTVERVWQDMDKRGELRDLSEKVSLPVGPNPPPLLRDHGQDRVSLVGRPINVYKTEGVVRYRVPGPSLKELLDSGGYSYAKPICSNSLVHETETYMADESETAMSITSTPCSGSVCTDDAGSDETGMVKRLKKRKCRDTGSDSHPRKCQRGAMNSSPRTCSTAATQDAESEDLVASTPTCRSEAQTASDNTASTISRSLPLLQKEMQIVRKGERQVVQTRLHGIEIKVQDHGKRIFAMDLEVGKIAGLEAQCKLVTYLVDGCSRRVDGLPILTLKNDVKDLKSKVEQDRERRESFRTSVEELDIRLSEAEAQPKSRIKKEVKKAIAAMDKDRDALRSFLIEVDGSRKDDASHLEDRINGLEKLHLRIDERMEAFEAHMSELARELKAKQAASRPAVDTVQPLALPESAESRAADLEYRMPVHEMAKDPAEPWQTDPADSTDGQVEAVAVLSERLTAAQKELVEQRFVAEAAVEANQALAKRVDELDGDLRSMKAMTETFIFNQQALRYVTQAK